jgi:hypothetical protein
MPCIPQALASDVGESEPPTTAVADEDHTQVADASPLTLNTLLSNE